MRPSEPAADFDHPLEMLAACHDRIEDRLQVLQRLRDHLAQHGCDEQARQAAANILRYFDTAGAHHHEDEEQDLFPRLTASAPADSPLPALVEALRNDHRDMRKAWDALRKPLQEVSEGRCERIEPVLVQRFVALYRRHIEREEAELLPCAERLLSIGEMTAIGAAMANRRGVRR
jgi:hemerythrin-like domain-containing protein